MCVSIYIYIYGSFSVIECHRGHSFQSCYTNIAAKCFYINLFICRKLNYDHGRNKRINTMLPHIEMAELKKIVPLYKCILCMN